MKPNQRVNYIGADFTYLGEFDAGIILKPLNKHLAEIVVPFSRKTQIKIGTYQSSKKR